MPVSKNRRKNRSNPENHENPADQKTGSYKITVIGLSLALVMGGGIYWWTAGSDDTHVAVAVPDLSGRALKGGHLFEENCGSCHGKHAAGSKIGPPLVHKIYEPSHHGDSAFYSAVFRGVRAHHWRYGNMPPVSGLSPQDVRSIVAYVRALQKENGIH